MHSWQCDQWPTNKNAKHETYKQLKSWKETKKSWKELRNYTNKNAKQLSVSRKCTVHTSQ